jgi:hypothetical protein
MDIICDGDSWTFGCELVSKEVELKHGEPGKHAGEYDYLQENDEYRTNVAWPEKLRKIINGRAINISWPADDNTTILNRTISYVTSQYLAKGKSTDELLVIVGWSSPERTSFWYKDSDISRRHRLQPNTEHFDSKKQEEFFRLYVEHYWHAEEYIPRFVMNALQLQNFCESHNIKYLQYNSFYQSPNLIPEQWIDMDVSLELNKLHGDGYVTTNKSERTSYTYDYKSIWNSINPVTFYKKNETNNTFINFIQNNCKEPFTGWHPSIEGHEAWANELYRYMIENKIIDKSPRLL